MAEENNLSSSAYDHGSEIYGDIYLNADNVVSLKLLGEREITDSKVVEIKKKDGTIDKKIGIKFVGVRGFILLLNQTNYRKVKDAYGDAFKLWVGKKVELKVVTLAMGGEDTQSIRVIVPPQFAPGQKKL